jgi:hypothetical protein
MFTHQQVQQFQTFGFVVARGLFDRAEACALATEVEGALADAFDTGGPDSDLGGIRGEYLPLGVDRCPAAQALIADDRRLFAGSAELLGVPAVPTIGVATRFESNASWHTDQGPWVGGVKFLAHLQPRAAESGALRVVPGSHHPGFAASLGGYRQRDPGMSGFAGWDWPHIVIETDPGDVIAFDVHLYHASMGGYQRLAWTIDYLPWPGLGDSPRLALVRDLVNDAVRFDHEPYDRDRFPVWEEWAAGAARSASRAVAVDRLRLLGVLGGGAR